MPLRKWIEHGLLFAAAVIGAAMIFLSIYWPFTEQAVIDVLQQRSVRSVTIGRFHRTYFPPGCIAEDIRFLRHKHKDKPPLITISKLVIEGSYWGMVPPHQYLSAVRVAGMHLMIPPKTPSGGGTEAVMPLTKSNSGSPMRIGTIHADGAVLDFMQRNTSQPPLRIVVQRLTLDGVGNNRPMAYHAILHNPEPPGEIRSQGEFGIWNPDDPGQTPVHGSFSFTKADLGYFKTISGIVGASGTFEGQLDNITVSGTADVPNFHVSGSARTRPLAARYRATVVATEGNVFLNDVLAHFDQTTLRISGAFANEPNQRGKNVSLVAVSNDARIEDLLGLVIEDRHSPMTGAVSFRTDLELPPRSQSFLRDMVVRGAFGVNSGEFTNRNIEGSLKGISRSAAEKDPTITENPDTVLSQVRGHVAVDHGIANLSGVTLTFPGGSAAMAGTYSLIDYRVDVHGRLTTEGSISAAQSGFRSFLLKAMTPFLKKKGRQELPFKITGAYSNANVALDFGHRNQTASTSHDQKGK